ncbi:hypothetical protein Q5Y75_08535 [Ruegeria sp. 2205SS24-7]|uniref:hypothetical protein n=1 Tax=Ruegeria discodermiae TaxID=3064389 RepID=UPI0027410CF5|nr:hypothetical protein [Ruegeria sp. 2205SS24-7]MDP5217260.1 hypothetical protein [Ruegeria sp. 2205SS24-7]
MENTGRDRPQTNAKDLSAQDAIEISDADLMKLTGGTTPVCWMTVAVYSASLAVSVIETTKEITNKDN